LNIKDGLVKLIFLLKIKAKKQKVVNGSMKYMTLNYLQ
jgi:hypothetical protein